MERHAREFLYLGLRLSVELEGPQLSHSRSGSCVPEACGQPESVFSNNGVAGRVRWSHMAYKNGRRMEDVCSRVLGIRN